MARDSWPGLPGQGFLAGDSWPGIPGQGFLARDSWPGIPGQGLLARDSWPGISKLKNLNNFENTKIKKKTHEQIENPKSQTEKPKQFSNLFSLGTRAKQKRDTTITVPLNIYKYPLWLHSQLWMQAWLVSEFICKIYPPQRPSN